MMRALLRQHDWSTSPLGWPKEWPASLRLVLNLMLDSKFPMFITWGDALGMLYNDAYSAVLGPKHPAALGRPFQEVWGEIWEEISPLVKKTLDGESSYFENFPLIVQRHAQMEPAWFTFSYSPLRDSTGCIAGIYCAVSETTHAVLAEQRQSFQLQLAERFSSHAKSDDVLASVAQLLGTHLHANRVVFAEIHAGSGVACLHANYTDGSVAEMRGALESGEFAMAFDECIKNGEVQIYDDVHLSPLSAPQASLARLETLKARSMLVVPIHRQAIVCCALLISDSKPRIWKSRELALAEDVAERMFRSFEYARAEADLDAERNLSHGILESITEGMVLLDHQFHILRINAEALRMERRSKSEFIGHTIWEAWPGLEETEVGKLFMQAMAQKKAVSHEHYYQFGSGLEAWLDMRAFPAPEGLIILYRDITERKLAQEHVRQAALHDPLTCLPNRALLAEHASHMFAAARRHRQSVAVIFVDLDRFKPINDGHGHDVGDAVLRQVALRLVQSVRKADIVFRLGGDEFLILLNNLREPEGAAEVARHIGYSISQPYPVDNLELSLSASIGISIFPRDADNIETLINHADAAMYKAKQDGRNSYYFYTADLDKRTTLMSTIEHQMKAALLQQQFHLLYQPVINIHTGDIISVEALLRWPHPGIGPDRFVPVAEMTGLIQRIGDWVLSEACRQHTLWRAHGMPPIPIAINISPVQFRQRDFVAHFLQIVANCNVDPAILQIELSEAALMEDIEHAIDMLRQLRAFGVKIAIDNFGTGFSSLTYLSRLPIDKIKVDKSFAQHIENDFQSRAITETIISLGRTFKLEIVAEGIESETALRYLRMHGCDQAQGFHVCTPIAADALEVWCRERVGQTTH